MELGSLSSNNRAWISTLLKWSSRHNWLWWWRLDHSWWWRWRFHHSYSKRGAWAATIKLWVLATWVCDGRACNTTKYDAWTGTTVNWDTWAWASPHGDTRAKRTPQCGPMLYVTTEHGPPLTGNHVPRWCPSILKEKFSPNTQKTKTKKTKRCLSLR